MGFDSQTFDRSGLRMTRRGWLHRTGLGVLAAGSVHRSVPTFGADDDPEKLIVRSRFPLDLETPVSALDQLRTPNDLFFVRSHFGAPAVAPGPWSVDVSGLVDRPMSLTRAELDRFAWVKVVAVLQCSGNGRVNFRPKVPGAVWDRGAVGNAEWAGVRFADVMTRCGLKAGAAHVHFLGADGPPSPKTPAFLRSVPLEKALHPDTLLALEMNGEPLPILHGGPIRLVVPGWAGNHWMKWVRSITVSDAEAPGFYMQTGYKRPKVPAPPNVVLKPTDLVSVTALNVKSLITWPLEGARLQQGRQEIRGVAWTGEGHVTKVEVAFGGTDAEPRWRSAAIVGDATPWGWRPWRIAVDAVPRGSVVARARATDSNDGTQPDVTPWNRSGYLWNGVDRVTFEVG